MTERQFSDWLVARLNDGGIAQRIETNINPGVPDLHACREGKTCWIELKIFTAGRVLLRKEQYAWGLKRSLHGDRVVVAALHPNVRIHVWKFPDLVVRPYGSTHKYLELISPWHDYYDRKLNSDTFLSYLFTC